MKKVFCFLFFVLAIAGCGGGSGPGTPGTIDKPEPVESAWIGRYEIEAVYKGGSCSGPYGQRIQWETRIEKAGSGLRWRDDDGSTGPAKDLGSSLVMSDQIFNQPLGGSCSVNTSTEIRIGETGRGTIETSEDYSSGCSGYGLSDCTMSGDATATRK